MAREPSASTGRAALFWLIAAATIAAAWPAAADGAMTGDGAGCTDRAKAAELATLEDTDPRYIAIWAEGMKDSSCRGFSTGQQVRVVERDGGLACVLAADDVSCHWIGDDIAPD